MSNLTALMAQAETTVTESGGGTLALLIQHLVAAFVFSLVGVVVFAGCLFLMERLTPFSLLHEIGEEHNIAAAIVIAAIVIGISVIIAAAILG